MWRCFVRDNGIGIADEHRESVFDMFTRCNSREEYAGEGIGLAVCKKVVEYHGGEIGVDSGPNEGTTFCFTVPVDRRWETLHRAQRGHRPPHPRATGSETASGSWGAQESHREEGTVDEQSSRG